jgi:hypothetical protein
MTRKRLTVTVFRPDDYGAALAASGQDVSLRVGSARELGRLYSRYGPAYTLWIGDRIAACMGVMIPWEGHGDGWAVWTPLGLRHPGLVHRMAKPGLRRIIRDYKLRRLQADVIAAFPAGRRWAEHMDLTFEGLMPAFGPHGETFARFAWINPNPVTELASARYITLEDGRLMPTISGGYGGEIVMIAMVALTVAAAAASAYATYSASEAQAKAMEYNAEEAQRQAEMVDQQTRFAAQQQAEKDRRTRAAARAIQGTSGVAVGEGSSLLVDLDSAKQAELNYQAIRYQGEGQVRSLRSQSVLDRFQAKSTRQQGLIGAGASLLGGAASGASQYSSMRTTAAPKTITVPSSSIYAPG